ncbi:MAG: transposase [gamma proteobacterium endosymbiont of Lamellibrachia anaximandri]|nr:transposase [gamma proteobacterium endosymbiont of Lamellibrachia anaximandri]
MARLPHFVLPGHPQHVIQRGNNREPIFCRAADYQFYLEKLEAVCQKYHCDLHAYVLMTNHTHLLITPQREEGIGKVMQGLGRYYVQYFNYTYKRTGTLWDGRYKATLLDSERYLLACMRYIELNPVRAGMVNHPSEYPWSSYHHNATGLQNGLIQQHSVYRRIGNAAKDRQAGCRALFKRHISGSALAELREATNKGRGKK